MGQYIIRLKTRKAATYIKNDCINKNLKVISAKFEI